MKITEEMKEITKLLDNYDTKSDCYLIGDYALLYGQICHERIEMNTKFLHDMKEKGVNVMEILDYSFDETKEIKKVGSVSYQDGWMLQRRAKGKPVHQESENIIISPEDSSIDITTKYYEPLRRYSNEIAIIAGAPQEHFDKFAKDFLLLSKSPLSLEPSVKNFYYSEESGFSFIDLQLNGNKPKYDTMLIIDLLNVLIYQPSILIAQYKGYSTVIDDIPDEIYNGLTKNIKIILDKTASALRKIPVRKTIIEDEYNRYFDMKTNLIVGGITQDDLMEKIDTTYDNMRNVYGNGVKF